MNPTHEERETVADNTNNHKGHKQGSDHILDNLDVCEFDVSPKD